LRAFGPHQKCQDFFANWYESFVIFERGLGMTAPELNQPAVVMSTDR